MFSYNLQRIKSNNSDDEYKGKKNIICDLNELSVLKDS